MNEKELLAFTALKANCYKVIKVNLTEDTFEIIRFDGEIPMAEACGLDKEKGFRALWESYVEGHHVYHDQLQEFRKYVNVDFISEFMRKYHGKEVFDMDFRCQVGTEMKPVRILIIAAEDYMDENQSVYLFFQGIGVKMREEYVQYDDLLRALSGNYEAIYYVDFDEDMIRPFRMNLAVEEAFGDYFRTCPTYEAAIGSYIDKIVAERDQEEMRAVVKYDFLRQQMKNIPSYAHEYHLERGGREYIYRMKISNLEGIGELHKAVVGFEDVSVLRNSAFSYYKPDNQIMIVDNNEKQSQQLAEILQEEYEICQVSNGKEALDYLTTHPSEIALVITSLHMPVMDGFELIKQMKRTRSISNIPVLVSTGSGIWDIKHRDEIETVCLDIGASDVLVKPYRPKIVLNRVKSIIHLQETTNMLNALERDPLTGLYTKDFFFRRVERIIRSNPDERYFMWVTDIAGLKVINEKYGIARGNEILITQSAGSNGIDDFVIGGRIEGDKLAALMRESAFEPIMKNAHNPTAGIDFSVPNVEIRQGIYHIRKNSSLPAQGMYDRALLALQKIKDTYGTYIAEYDDVIREDLLKQRQVAENAQRALDEHQFVVYYQPKFDVQSKKTNGAEALVRWIHPELGFMNPGVFVPLFEQNGFIKKLDFYVWEDVCRTLKQWQDSGMCMVPVSVNVSRRDFEDEDLAKKVIALVDSYGIDHSYFHVELTESSYSDNPQQIAQTIKQFHDSGFVVELDDFGSGYSSMSALSELDLDVMKLDMSIIQKDDPSSDKSVLEFSMQLAKMMQLKTVAEGVETADQVKRIASLGGDYIQGYYYSKPLPREQFEKYLVDEAAKAEEQK